MLVAEATLRTDAPSRTDRRQPSQRSSALIQPAITTFGGMTKTAPAEAHAGSTMLSKVHEVTVWFWIIKILCTTVGESFADWISTTVGLGLSVTALIFTVALGVVLGFQLVLDRYVPIVYWLAVVVLSITGTLYTDLLTDKLHVPLAISTGVFAVTLAVVFAVWYV